MIVLASCGIDGSKVIAYKPLVEAALKLTSDSVPAPRCIVFQRPQCRAALGPRDLDWATACASAIENGSAKSIKPEEMLATDPLYILYTSGMRYALK